MNITFDVKNQIISRTNTNRVVADSKNYLYAEFKFTSDWNGTKTAIFSNDNVETTYEQLLTDDKCLVPAEVLKAGTLCVSAFCGDLVTANKAYLVVEESGLKDGETPAPPTPDIYTQILEKAEHAEAVASEVQEKADSGAFNGAPGKDGAAATVTVGIVTTGEPGTDAAVTNTGTENAAVLDFVIPQGVKGDKGDKGDTGVGINDWLNPLDLSAYVSSRTAFNVLSLEDGGYICTNSGYITNNDDQIGRGVKILKGSLIVVQKADYCAIINGDGQYFIVDGDDHIGRDCLLATFSDLKIKLATKQNVVRINTPQDTNITLQNESEYRCQVIESLNLALPASIDDNYECTLIFESGNTATVLGYAADSIKFVGDDCDAEGDFIPAADKGYEISVKNLGFDRIIARVGAFPI